MDLESTSFGIDERCGWECNFHFGYGKDLLEETIINEQSCIQVLKVLNAKADAEICELEDNLAILQSQLKLAEHEDHGVLYKVLTDTFQEKITSLSASIQSMKTEKVPHDHDLNPNSEIHGRPPERIYHIITALLGDHSSTNNGQVKVLHDAKSMLDSDKLNADKVKENSIPAEDGSFDSSESKERQMEGKVLNLSKGRNMPENNDPLDTFLEVMEQNLVRPNSGSDYFVRPEQKSSVNKRLDETTNTVSELCGPVISTCIITNANPLRNIYESSAERKEKDGLLGCEENAAHLMQNVKPTNTISEHYNTSTSIITKSNDTSICKSTVERKEKNGLLGCEENAAMQNVEPTNTISEQYNTSTSIVTKSNDTSICMSTVERKEKYGLLGCEENTAMQNVEPTNTISEQYNTSRSLITKSNDISICKSTVERKEKDGLLGCEENAATQNAEPTNTTIITKSNDTSICKSTVERKEKDGLLGCEENAGTLNVEALKSLDSPVVSERKNVKMAVKVEALEEDEQSGPFASKRGRNTGGAKRGKVATAKRRSSSNLSVWSDGKLNFRESGHSDSKPDNLQLINSWSLSAGQASGDEIPLANLMSYLQGLTKRKLQNSRSCHVSGRNYYIPEAKKLRPDGTCKDHLKQYSRVAAAGKKLGENGGNWTGSNLFIDACANSQENAKDKTSESKQLVVFNPDSKNVLQDAATDGTIEENLNCQNVILRQLQSLKVDDLRAIAKRYGVRGIYKLKKELLVDELLGRLMMGSLDGV